MLIVNALQNLKKLFVIHNQWKGLLVKLDMVPPPFQAR